MSNEVKTKEKIDMDPKYIVKLTVTLLGTCLIVALLLGLVNGVTAGPIAEINQQKTEAAMLAVVSDPDNTTFSDALELSGDMTAAATAAGFWSRRAGVGTSMGPRAAGAGKECRQTRGTRHRGRSSVRSVWSRGGHRTAAPL